jgi:anaerobic selenocysteine-containing dehydrogenase
VKSGHQVSSFKLAGYPVDNVRASPGVTVVASLTASVASRIAVTGSQGYAETRNWGFIWGMSDNPAFMHPSNLARLGPQSGDLVSIQSRNEEVVGVVEEDSDLRTGIVSITHGFGHNLEPSRGGANVNLLTRSADDFEPYSGMPRMGALPIAVRPVR